MVLTQVFDYMLKCGVKYGYVTAGESFVFLYVDWKDLRTLYYGLCIPNKETEDKELLGQNGVINKFYTAVA